MTKPEAQRVGRGGIEGAGINETSPSLLLFLPSSVIGKTAPRGTQNNPVVLEGQLFSKLFLLNATKVFFGGEGHHGGEEEMATPLSSCLKKPMWTEEPGGLRLQSWTRLSTFSGGGEGC